MEHLNPEASHKYGTTKSNTQKSKNVSVASFTIEGLSIDVVKLLKFEYDEDKKLQLSLGTPESDCFRRDITINALFYNIKERKVEDFTNMGLSDIKNRIIRTPFDPVESFREDAMRLMRSIRFAYRFDFELDQSIEQAAKDEIVR
mmetsp:Transcript_37024/g.26911  ORF Transcript_37024/g.26911 Transcript_37024/m.26911 type:complete len:145 (+) Transcript_37024:252-686(+)